MYPIASLQRAQGFSWRLSRDTRQGHCDRERHCLKFWDPTGQAQESKPAPAQKVKKESPGESPRESPGVPADAPKRVKNESPGDSVSQNSPVF